MAETPAGNPKPAPDWERIEADYTAGILSLREIANADGNVTEGAIRKRAKGSATRPAWERDLSAKIHAKADALVRREAVRSEVRSESVLTERVIVEANAEYIAKVRGSHRGDIASARETLGVLALQLKGTIDDSLMADIRNLAAFEPEDPTVDYGPELAANNRALAAAVDKLGQFSTRIAGAKSLTEALGNVIRLEREALGLDAKSAGDHPPGGRSFSDVERVARLATILDKARRARDAGEKPAGEPV